MDIALGVSGYSTNYVCTHARVLLRVLILFCHNRYYACFYFLHILVLERPVDILQVAHVVFVVFEKEIVVGMLMVEVVLVAVEGKMVVFAVF